MKGFKPCVKMAHGGYMEGGLSSKMGPPTKRTRRYAEGSEGGVKADEDMGGRRAGEGEAAQLARAKEKSRKARKDAADSIREIDPELGYVGNIKNIIGKQYDMMDAFRGADRAKSETGYKKGGKVQKVMHEFKTGKLHSGSHKGPIVKNRKQAIAIALSEAGKSKKKG